MSEKRRDNKGRILRDGEGQRPDGQYMFRYTDAYGKRQTVYSWRLVSTDKLPDGKRPCEALRDMKKKIQMDLAEDIRTADANTMSVNELFAQFMDMRQDLKLTTRNNYRCLYDKHVRDAIGLKTLRNVRYSTIQKFYMDLIQKSNLKYSSVQSINALLYQMFTVAVKDSLIRLNPTTGALKEVKRILGTQQEKRHALTEEEQARLVEFVYRTRQYKRWGSLITVLLGTGMRIGEALGLRWKDCDFKKNMIHVSRALLYRENEDGAYEYRVSETKTPAGMRVIPMLPEVRTALLDLQKLKLHMGHEPFVVDGYSGFIFLNSNGKVFTPGAFFDAIQNITNAYNREEFFRAADEHREPCYLPKFSAHILRHTFCTRLCENEKDLKIIQDVMGHKNFRTTMDVYNEATLVRKAASFKSLEGKFKLA